MLYTRSARPAPRWRFAAACSLLAVTVSACPASERAIAPCAGDGECEDGAQCADSACASARGPGRERHRAGRGDPDRDPGAGSGPRARAAAELTPTFARGGAGGAGWLSGAAPADEPRERWSVDLGARLTASPTLVQTPEGTWLALIGTHSGRFVALALDGERKPTVAVDLLLDGKVWASAASDGRTAWVGTDRDTLHAIDLGDGVVRWSKVLGDCAQPQAPGPEGVRCDLDGGPTLAPDGDLLVGGAGIFRVAPGGELRWHWRDADRPAAHFNAAPVVRGDGSIIVSGEDGRLSALSPEGALLWQQDLRADVDGAAVIDGDGGVIVGVDDGTVRAFDSAGVSRWTVEVGGEVRAPLLRTRAGSVVAASTRGKVLAIAHDGAVAWSAALGASLGPPVEAEDGTILVGRRGGQVYALDAEGRTRWAVEVFDDTELAPGLMPEGVLVVASEDGVVSGFVASR